MNEDKKPTPAELFSELAKLIQEGKEAKRIQDEKNNRSKKDKFIEKYNIKETTIDSSNFINEFVKFKNEINQAVEESKTVHEPVKIINEPIFEEKEVIQEPVDLVTRAVESITKVAETTNLFSTTPVEKTSPNFKAIQDKLKYLEQWVSKISMTGPGSGSYWLNDLGDTDKLSLQNASDGQVLTFSSDIGKWIASNATGNSNNVIVNTTDQYARDTANSSQANTIYTQGVDTWQNNQINLVNNLTQNVYNYVNSIVNIETLDSVTTRGNTTNNGITVSSLTVPVGSVLSGEDEIIANIAAATLNAILERGDSANLNIGDYGLTNGITGDPYTVYELKDVPSPALQVNDIIGGAAIPVLSKILFVGTGGNNKIIITNKNFVEGATLPPANTVITFARPIINAGLSLSTGANTDITLNPGVGGYIVPHSDIIPYTTNIWSLGTPAKRFKEIWLGSGTIYVQDETLGNDQALGARDGNFYIDGGAGLDVGEFILKDNNIRIKNPARDVYFGSTGATANVVFNRSIKVQEYGNSNRAVFQTDRTGRTQFYVPTIANNDIGAVSIIGSPAGNYHAVTSTGGMLHITGNDGASNRFSMDAFGSGGNQSFNGLIARAGRGTSANPTQLLAGDIILRLAATGWRSDTGFSGVPAGGAASTLDFISLEATTDATRGSAQAFYNAPLGNNIRTFSGLFNSTGLSFVKQSGDTANDNIGITFSNGDRLTYFPPQDNKAEKFLKVVNVGGQYKMSWESTPTVIGAVVYKGLYVVSTNSPPITDASGEAGWQYTVSSSSPVTVNFGIGPLVVQDGDLLIHNGTHYDLIPGPRTQVNADWSANTGVAAILNKPNLFSGSYNDLTNKPTIPAAQVNADWSANTGVAAILNKPTLTNGTVTSVTGTGTVSGLTLTGTVTSTGNLTLGGTLDKTSSSVFGVAKVDNTTITANNGVISAVIPSYGIGGNQLVYELNGSLNLTSAKNTLVSMFGLTSGVALQSNTRYHYEIVFSLSSNKAGALSYALALNGGAVVAQHNFQWMGNKTTTIDGYSAGIAMASFNATGAAITTAKDIAAFDNFTHVVIYGNIDVTTAGSVNFMLSQDQNTPITWTMLPGAYVKLLPLGAIGSNTVSGTWS